MSFIELKGVSRFYQINKNQKKYVLKDVTLSFPYTGLIAILGKSGCGKSTLLNLIGKLDSPSEGHIFYDDKPIAVLNEKQLAAFHKSTVSYIFQHYHLLENQTALYNIMLPALLNGDQFFKAKNKVLTQIEHFSITKDMLYKKCSKLSGGEKERVAVMRAFINEPRAILADEPTGALDKDNALMVMESLKRASQSSLVIMVTHNEELARVYSDRIIHMKDGKIVKDERINSLKKAETEPKKEKRSNPNWYNKIILKNFTKRFKRSIFSISALTIGLTASMLIFGFSNGARDSIALSTQKQFDYGVASISKEKKIISDNSPITLIQTMRADKWELDELRGTYDFMHFCYSYDSLVSPAPETYINEKEIKGFSYLPVYSFVDKSTDHSLLQKGKIPKIDTLNQVVVNESAYDLLKKETKSDPLNTYIRIKDTSSFTYYTDEVEQPYITDYFVYDRLVQIVGVVKELSFLNSPKLYYSYVAMDKLMNETLLNNLSSYQGEITWKERIIAAPDNEYIANYSHKVFLKNSGDVYLLKEMKANLDSSFSLNSNALTIEETLFSLVDAASVGMEVFLVIALVGTAMIIGIISFASYSEDIKDSAILLCLGAKRDDITMLYIIENLLIGAIGIVLSFIITLLITSPLNSLVERFTSLIEIIDVPFSSFHNHAYLFPILIIVGAFFVCSVATYFPIAFSKRISLKEELKAND